MQKCNSALFLCVSVNRVLFSLRLLCRSGELSCNFFLRCPLALEIYLVSASCSSPFRVKTASMSGMVNLTRSLCFCCAPLFLLVAESLTLLSISAVRKILQSRDTAIAGWKIHYRGILEQKFIQLHLILNLQEPSLNHSLNSLDLDNALYFGDNNPGRKNSL